MTLSNRIRLEDLRRMPVREIAALPAEALALLQDEAEEALRNAKSISEWLDGAIGIRFGERAQAERQFAGKDTGTVRFTEGPVTIVADLPKRVDWDQDKLSALVARIRADGGDPAEYVDIAFKVPERKYAAWPSQIRCAFEDARTVRTGKPSFRLTLTCEEF